MKVRYIVGRYDATTGEVAAQAFKTREEAMHTNLNGCSLGFMHPGWRFRSDTGELFLWPGCDTDAGKNAIIAWLDKHGYTNLSKVTRITVDKPWEIGSDLHRAHGFYRNRVTMRQYWDKHSLIGDSLTRTGIDGLFEGWAGSGTTNYWIADDGTATQVDNHAGGAYDILGKDYRHSPDPDDADTHGPYAQMFARGYCRVVIDRYTDVIYVEKPGKGLSKAQRAKLEDWCIERQMPLVRTSLMGAEERAIFNPPLPPVPMAEGWQGAGLRNYWLDKDGKFSKVDERMSHYQAAGDIEELDHPPQDVDDWIKYTYDTMYERGYFRVVMDLTERSIYVEGRDLTRKQLSELKVMADENNCALVRGYVGSTRVKVLSDPHPEGVQEGWKGNGVVDYWVDRNAKFVKCVQGHLLGAINLLHLPGPPEEGEGAAYVMMFEAGWVRVVVEYDNYEIQVDTGEKELNRAQLVALKDLAIERHSKLVLTVFPANGGQFTKTLFDPQAAMAESRLAKEYEPEGEQPGYIGVVRNGGVVANKIPDVWSDCHANHAAFDMAHGRFRAFGKHSVHWADTPNEEEKNAVESWLTRRGWTKFDHGGSVTEAIHTEDRPLWFETEGDTDVEHIVSAAVRDVKTGDIYLGDCHASARKVAGVPMKPGEKILGDWMAGGLYDCAGFNEGFLTSKGKFVTRASAQVIARNAKQFPKKYEYKELGRQSQDYEIDWEASKSYRQPRNEAVDDYPWRKLATGGNSKLQRYWQDKDGKLNWVVSHEHGAVKLRPDLFPPERFPNGVASTQSASDEIYGDMARAGYARITCDGWDAAVYAVRGGYQSKAYDGGPFKLSRAQERALTDMAIELGWKLVLDQGGRTSTLYEPEQELPEA